MPILSHFWLRRYVADGQSSSRIHLPSSAAGFIQRGLIREFGRQTLRSCESPPESVRTLSRQHPISRRGMAGPGCINSSFEHIAIIPGLGCFRDSLSRQRRTSSALRSARSFSSRSTLRLTYRRIINGQNLQRIFFLQPVFIEADNRLITRIDSGLTAMKPRLHLRQSCADSFGHAAQCLDP